MTRVAVVDVGTNSLRLLVAEPGEDGALRQLDRRMRITRLGAGVDARGELDDAALGRTFACLDEYAAVWTELGATRVRISATSAIRDAADRERFFAGVRARTGVDAEVLTPEDEARHAFLGATAGLDAAAGPFLVLDIGGGSTELILGQVTAERTTSRQLGCVRLTERLLPSDPPTAEELASARAEAAAEIDAAAEALEGAQARTLIGVAGTVTTLGALHLDLPEYLPEAIHGLRLSREAVGELTDRLAAMPARERAELGPMAPGREDVIVGGAVILHAAMRRLDFAEIRVSEADILDGLARSLLERV